VSALKVFLPGMVVAHFADLPYHRRSFAGFLPQILVFNPRAVPVEPVVDKIARTFDVITSLVSMEHGVYGCEKVTSLGEVTSNGQA
jgi:hypothetical protein